ncbi:unnamed protein product [Brassica oleracea]
MVISYFSFTGANPFIFMGYRYSTKNKPCTYDETKTCKPALATAADESHIFYMWSEDESHIFQI